MGRLEKRTLKHPRRTELDFDSNSVNILSKVGWLPRFMPDTLQIICQLVLTYYRLKMLCDRHGATRKTYSRPVVSWYCMYAVKSLVQERSSEPSYVLSAQLSWSLVHGWVVMDSEAATGCLASPPTCSRVGLTTGDAAADSLDMHKLLPTDCRPAKTLVGKFWKIWSNTRNLLNVVLLYG